MTKSQIYWVSGILAGMLLIALSVWLIIRHKRKQKLSIIVPKPLVNPKKEANKELQRQLNTLLKLKYPDYPLLAVDGIIGKKTKEAIAKLDSSTSETIKAVLKANPLTAAYGYLIDLFT